MKKHLLLIYLLCTVLHSFAQKKKFNSFELLYNITQQVPESHDWPKYGLESMTFYNDTIFTLLIKENYITSIPLARKGEIIGNQKFSSPQSSYPITMARNKGKWFVVTMMNGIICIEKNGDYKRLIATPQKGFFNNIMIINNQILAYLFSNGNKIFKLYDFNGNLIYTSKEGEYAFINPVEYNDTIRDGYKDYTVKNNTIHISDDYDWEKYGDYSFVGGYQDMGYFIDRENRNNFIIRDLKDLSIKEQFFIPVKFKDTDLGIPEEDSFNLRVFSRDNNTFYFVTIKHGHLLIYKAVR